MHFVPITAGNQYKTFLHHRLPFLIDTIAHISLTRRLTSSFSSSSIIIHLYFTYTSTDFIILFLVTYTSLTLHPSLSCRLSFTYTSLSLLFTYSSFTSSFSSSSIIIHLYFIFEHLLRLSHSISIRTSAWIIHYLVIDYLIVFKFDHTFLPHQLHRLS